MERKFLEELGLDKAAIDKVLDANSADIGGLKKQVEDATKDRDTYKGQLEAMTIQLKAFDGVDVAKLQGEIQKLQGDLATQQTTHAAEIADRDFQGNLTAAIAAEKGKNSKAIMALLDSDTLKASKNQKADIAAAIKALRDSDAYLFEDGKAADTPPTTPAKVSTGGTHDEGGAGAAPTTNAQMNALITGKLRGE